MRGTGIFVTKEELERVQTEQKCSGMYLSGGNPMGRPQEMVLMLARIYDVPKGSGLNIKTGEFCFKD